MVVACSAVTDSRRGVDGAALPLRGSVSGHEGCVVGALLSVLGGSEVNDRRSFDPRRAAPLRARRDGGSSAPLIAASFRHKSGRHTSQQSTRVNKDPNMYTYWDLGLTTIVRPRF